MFYNNKPCFIVKTEQSNSKIYYKVCGVLNTSVANKDIVEQGCPQFFSLRTIFKMTRSKWSTYITNTKHLLIYIYTEYALYKTMHNWYWESNVTPWYCTYKLTAVMRIGDKQPSILHTIYTLGAGGFLHKVFEWLKNELSPRAFFHGQF